jgi:hypothetical protein
VPPGPVYALRVPEPEVRVRYASPRAVLSALAALGLTALLQACSGAPEAPAPPAAQTPAPPTAAPPAPARIVPTANPRSVPPTDRGALADAGEALSSIRALPGDPHALLAAYAEGASRAITLDLAPFELGADSVIADIGAGTGALPVRLLVEQRPFARLYAVETDATSLEILGAALEGLEGRERVLSVLSQPDDVSLPPASIDRAIVIDTSIGCLPPAGHEITVPPPRRQASERLLASLRRAVAEDARVHLLRPWNAPPAPPYRCPADWVIQSMGQAGFELLEQRPQTPPPGEEPEHQAFHLVFAPAPA